MGPSSSEEVLAALGLAMHSGLAAADPEAALRQITALGPVLLGDREAEHRSGALKPGERQFTVSGAFMVTPDRRHNLLLAEHGFPAEQHRLRIDVGLAHPGWVVEHGRPLLLANTDLDPGFRQILKTARMGSAVYAPMVWKGTVIGQLVLASQARNTYGERDLHVLVTFAGAATALWQAHDGAAFWRVHDRQPLPAATDVR